MMSRADDGGGLLEGDRHVVARVGFGGRGEDRSWKLLALLEAGGEADAADGAGRLVVFPAGAGDVAARRRTRSGMT